MPPSARKRSAATASAHARTPWPSSESPRSRKDRTRRSSSTIRTAIFEPRTGRSGRATGPEGHSCYPRWSPGAGPRRAAPRRGPLDEPFLIRLSGAAHVAGTRWSARGELPMAYQIIDPPPASLEVSLVIPVKDEAENVLLLADEIRAAMEPSPYAWECIWVDDGSSDGTGDLLRRAAASRSPAAGAHARAELRAVRRDGLRALRRAGEAPRDARRRRPERPRRHPRACWRCSSRRTWTS